MRFRVSLSQFIASVFNPAFRKICVAAKPALIYATLLTTHVSNEHERDTGRARMLAGYHAPPDLITALVMGRLIGAIRDMSSRLVVPVILHDERPVVPRSALVGLTVFEYPGSGVIHATTAAAEPHANAETLAAHARFLADTELDPLVRMHSWMGGVESQALFSFWDDKLTWLLTQPDAKALAETARAKLAAVQLTLGIPTAQAARVG